MWAKSECQGMLLAVADNILGMTLPEDRFVQDSRKHLLCTLNRANHTIEITVNPGSYVHSIRHITRRLQYNVLYLSIQIKIYNYCTVNIINESRWNSQEKFWQHLRWFRLHQHSRDHCVHEDRYSRKTHPFWDQGIKQRADQRRDPRGAQWKINSTP